MADLAPRPAAHGLDLPLHVGRTTLAVLPDAPMASVAPFRGREAEVAAVLGAGLPAAGGAAGVADGVLIWAGLGLWLLRGVAAERIPGLAEAAVTDQGDAWCGFALSGADAADVLARLVPVDLDPSAFPPGSVARTRLKDIACVLLRTDPWFEILVARSVARTAAHQLATAMRALAARAALQAQTARLTAVPGSL